MKGFRKGLDEIYMELGKLRLFDHILDSLLIFLGIFILLMVTNISSMFAFIPGIAYGWYKIHNDMIKKRDRVLWVEDKYPELDEKLRTAVDNIKLENPVVEELQDELYQDLKKVQVASFLDTKRTSLKLVGIVVLCFLILIFALFGIEFIDFNDAVVKMREYAGGGYGTGNSSLNPFSTGMAENENLFGNESVADIGNEVIDLEIELSGIEPTFIRSEEDASDEFEESFPSDVDLVAACREPPCIFENDIPIDQQELVKNYFIELSK